jgi:hypothetical protein
MPCLYEDCGKETQREVQICSCHFLEIQNAAIVRYFFERKINILTKNLILYARISNTYDLLEKNVDLVTEKTLKNPFTGKY